MTTVSHKKVDSEVNPIDVTIARNQVSMSESIVGTNINRVPRSG